MLSNASPIELNSSRVDLKKEKQGISLFQRNANIVNNYQNVKLKSTEGEGESK